MESANGHIRQREGPSGVILHDCENVAESSFAALLHELGGGGGVGDLVADSDTSHFTFSILAVLGCVTSRPVLII